MSGLRLLRAVRLDASDERVFPEAASDGEWLVGGGFLWEGVDPERLEPKAKLAFAQGFLGIESLGFASLAAAGRIEPGELSRLRTRLAEALHQRLGAPDPATAEAAAEALLADSLELARDLPPGALLAVERRLDPANGGIVERLRRLEAPPGLHARVFAIVPEEDEVPVEARGPDADR